MISAAWVMVLVLNGNPVQSEPMGAEACILTMLSTKHQETLPYCMNTETHQVMNFPPECREVRPMYCKPN